MEGNMSNPKESPRGLGSVVVDRRGFGRFLRGAGLAAATVAAGAATSASRDVEPSQKTPRVEPVPAPRDTLAPTGTSGAEPRTAPSPGQPAGAEATKAATSAVIVEAKGTPPAAPPDKTTAPTAAPKEPALPEPRPPVIYTDVLLTEELLVSDFLNTGGGEAPAIPKPTADTGQQEVLPFPIHPFEFTKLAFGLPQETEFKQVTKDPMLALYYDVAQATFRGTDGGSVEISERSNIRFFRFKVKHPPGAQEAVLNEEESLPRMARVKIKADFTVIGEVKGKDGKSKSVVVVTDYQRPRGDYRVPSHFVLFLDTYGEGNTLEGFVKGAGFKFERSSGSPTIIYKVDGRDYSLPIKRINDSIAEKLQARAGVLWVEQTKEGQLYPNPVVPYPAKELLDQLFAKDYSPGFNKGGVPALISLSGTSQLAEAEYVSDQDTWSWVEKIKYETVEKMGEEVELIVRESLARGEILMVDTWTLDGGEVAGYAVGSDRQPRLALSGLKDGFRLGCPTRGTVFLASNTMDGSLLIGVKATEHLAVFAEVDTTAARGLVSQGAQVDVGDDLFEITAQTRLSPLSGTRQPPETQVILTAVMGDIGTINSRNPGSGVDSLIKDREERVIVLKR